MGIKRLKEKFKIEHIVQQKTGYIAIGSGYVSDLLMIIQPSLELRWGNLGPSKNDDLARYHDEMYQSWKCGDLDKIINEPDCLGLTIPVWTHNSGKVIKKECEEFGWPNTTTDGELMYENTFFKDRPSALRDCKKNSVYAFLSLKHSCYNVYREVKILTRLSCMSAKRIFRSFIFFGY